MNKKGSAGIVIGIILVILLIGVLSMVGSYNNLVAKDTTVEEKWGNVQSAYQRRADLIPSLVNTVKGYASHEEGVFTAVTEARAAMKSAGSAAELAAADKMMTSALGRLNFVVEAYPELKASENFMALQDELAGTENRVKYERDQYNKGVKAYKVTTRRFPTILMANMFGFDQGKWDMFEAAAGSENAPVVSFE